MFLFSLCIAAISTHAFAANEAEKTSKSSEEAVTEMKAQKRSILKTEENGKGLTIGGYGEAVYSHNFYSDKYIRYTAKDPSVYKGQSHGRFDLPHVVLFLNYNFGHGWSMGSEIEFEHGGTESAIEIEEEEAGEYESEIERGGEVALEQFWIQKSICPEFNIKLGHIIVPVGGTNQNHLPTEFFGVYRPEGENTILPCTWHETGISLWGRVGDWRYEALLVPGLDSDRFNRLNWIQGGAGSPYEFKIGNSVAGAFRIDNYSIKGLRLSLSGYAGNSFNNSLNDYKDSDKYKDVKGTVMIGAFDFNYNDHNWIVRGNFDYGHLSDADKITEVNKKMSNNSPSPQQNVAEAAIATGIEAGYNVFSQINKLNDKGQKLYVFGRYDYYDSMHKTSTPIYKFCGRNRIAAGVNYYPIHDIVVKGEYSIGLMRTPYNNEPAISVGVAYAGFFTKLKTTRKQILLTTT